MLVVYLILLRLLAEGDALGESGQTTGGLREDHAALAAGDDCVSMGEEGGDGLAAGTLDVHVKGVGALDDALEFVGSLLQSGRGVQDVDAKCHVRRV